MALSAPAGLQKLAAIFSFASRETCVGLSIGSSSIKLVELEKSGSGWRLRHFGMIQLPEDAISNREIANSIAVVECLKSLVGQINLGSKNVCSSLSGTSVIIKRLSLESKNMKDFQDEVFWEAEQYIPFDISEVFMDYHLLSPPKTNPKDVLIVAVKRVVLESYMSAIEDAGLKPKVIDVDYFALQSIHELNYPTGHNDAVAIVDIGASATKMVVVQNGVPIFTKDATLGGMHLTAEIQQRLGLSFADAETLKTGDPAGLPAEVSELMHVMAENFAGEIKRSIDFHNASSSGVPIAAILLTGGSAKVPGVSKIVEEQTGLPTQIMNPFNAIEYDPQVFTPEYIQSIAPLAAVPLGLALRRSVK